MVNFSYTTKDYLIININQLYSLLKSDRYKVSKLFTDIEDLIINYNLIYLQEELDKLKHDFSNSNPELTDEDDEVMSDISSNYNICNRCFKTDEEGTRYDNNQFRCKGCSILVNHWLQSDFANKAFML